VKTLNYIAGAWQPAGQDREFDVRNPADESLIARVPDSAADDARRAADAAHAAFPGWRSKTADERARVLKKWHALIVQHQEEIGELISREQGKPIAEGRGEVAYSAGYVEWFAEEAVRANGEIIAAPVTHRRLLVVKEPVGVVAVVTPWNFPAAMIARKIAPALAAGCTVVAKPAEDTPLTSLLLVELAEQAGVPPGVLNIVTASRERAGEVVGAWLADGRVRKISFTGSTQVGKLLARESAATLKKLSLELGGNAPFIVFEDADVEAAVDGAMIAKMRNMGEACTAANRFLVHESVARQFGDLLGARMGALRTGRGQDAGTDVGPLINADAVESVGQLVTDAVHDGAEVVTGGSAADGPGHFFEPTVLLGVPAEARINSEEIFGPVAPITTFTSDDEAIELANATEYGLASYVYTRDLARTIALAEALEFGMVGINTGLISNPAAPFGGVKASGFGREGGFEGIDEYLDTTYVALPG